MMIRNVHDIYGEYAKSRYQFKCLNVLLNNSVVIIMTSDELHIDLKKPTDT